MNTVQVKWLQEALIKLLILVFMTGVLLGQSLVALIFLKDVMIIVILSAAVGVYYMNQAYQLYNEIGSKITNRARFE